MEVMTYPPLVTSVEQLAERLIVEVERTCVEPAQKRYIWSDTVWAVLSSHRPLDPV